MLLGDQSLVLFLKRTFSSLATRAIHVYDRKIRKHVQTTEQYRSGLERHGNGKLEQCGEGEKTRVFREQWGWGRVKEELPRSLHQEAVLLACHTFRCDFIPFEPGVPSLPRVDPVILFVWNWKTVDKLKGQLTQCISHQRVSEKYVYVRLFENLGCKGCKENRKEKMQKKKIQFFLEVRGNVLWPRSSFSVFLTFPVPPCLAILTDA